MRGLVWRSFCARREILWIVRPAQDCELRRKKEKTNWQSVTAQRRALLHTLVCLHWFSFLLLHLYYICFCIYAFLYVYLYFCFILISVLYSDKNFWQPVTLQPSCLPLPILLSVKLDQNYGSIFRQWNLNLYLYTSRIGGCNVLNTTLM